MQDQPFRLGWRAAGAVACALGVLVLVWHADTLRLGLDGRALVWPAVIAFAVAWSARTDAPWKTAAGLCAGSLIAAGAFYEAQHALPLTPLGTAVGLACGAALLATAMFLARGALPVAASIAGYGGGVAAAQLVGVTTSSSVADVLAIWTAFAFAALLGLLAAQALAAAADLIRPHRTHAGGAS